MCSSASPDGLPISDRSLSQPVAQTLRPDVGPVLLDVFQTRGPCGFAVHHSPTGGDVSERRPQAVLFFVVDQDEEATVVVVERVVAHSFSSPPTSVAKIAPLTFDSGAK